MEESLKHKWQVRVKKSAMINLFAHLLTVLVVVVFFGIARNPGMAPAGFAFYFGYNLKLIALAIVVMSIAFFFRKKLNVTFLKIVATANVAISIFYCFAWLPAGFAFRGV